MKIKQKPLDLTIPNWSMFGIRNVAVNVFEKHLEDGMIVYTSGLLIWLNDGQPEEDCEELTITVFTDIVTEDAKQTALIVAEYASNLFENVSSLVYVFDDDGSVLQEFDLNEEFEENMEFDDNTSKIIH